MSQRTISPVIIHLILAPSGHSNIQLQEQQQVITQLGPITSFLPQNSARNNVSFISAAAVLLADRAAAARNVNWILIDAENNPLPGYEE